MKFSWKVFFCTIVIMAAALSISGYFLVTSVFNMALEREVQLSLDENSILCFAFETAALNVPTKYEQLQNTAIEQIGQTLTANGYTTNHFIRISDEQKSPIFTNEGFLADNNLLLQIEEDTKAYKVIKEEKRYYLQIVTILRTVDRTLYLETLKDISSIFEERNTGFSIYHRVTAIILFFNVLVMFFLSLWLTKPIKILSRATKNMSEGNYHFRAEKVSNDELGVLTTDFNQMANALEEKINLLKEESSAREEFIAAFAHELKTPLTSIIGHAELLCSRKMEEEQQLLSARHISREGKRLEVLSFRLLDIIVLKNQKLSVQFVAVSSFLAYLEDAFSYEENIMLKFDYEEAFVLCETSLIKTVLVNLIDNARKASHDGGSILVQGRLFQNEYRFSVHDFGIGIPKEELSKITKAFYMVDKSRSRSYNGAGLGLALCTEILSLHQSNLQFESIESEGTCVSFVLKSKKEREL